MGATFCQEGVAFIVTHGYIYSRQHGDNTMERFLDKHWLKMCAVIWLISVAQFASNFI